MYPTDCCALPCIASPCRGLNSLSVYAANRWQHQNQTQRSSPYCFSPTTVAWRYINNNNKSNTKTEDNIRTNNKRDVSEMTLPKDPRQWSREDVAYWVQYVMTVNRLPSVQLDRFLMNGKALCLMTIDMFVKRVPLGGKLLYKDFQLRLSSALYS